MSFILLGILNSQVTAAAGGSYELIESNILTSSASSVTFSSIPQDYKHLQLRMVTKSDRASSTDFFYLQLNGDTGSNYARHGLYGTGSSVSSLAVTSTTAFQVGLLPAASDTNLNYEGSVVDLLDYTNTNKNSTIRALWGQSGLTSRINLFSGVWMNTNAVSSMTLFPFAGPLKANSRFSLYGIRG